MKMALEIISWPKLYEGYVAEPGFQHTAPGLQIQCSLDFWLDFSYTALLGPAIFLEYCARV